MTLDDEGLVELYTEFLAWEFDQYESEISREKAGLVAYAIAELYLAQFGRHISRRTP